jgi:hypothetical protein
MKRLNKFLQDNPDAAKSFDWAVFIIAGICLISLLLYPEDVFGERRAVRSDVYGVLTGDDWGGCMVQIGAIPVDAGLDCPDSDRSWLALDCEGRFGSTMSANNSLRTAKAALLTGSKVTVTVDDEYKVGGFCYAPQLILFRQ